MRRAVVLALIGCVLLLGSACADAQTVSPSTGSIASPEADQDEVAELVAEPSPTVDVAPAPTPSPTPFTIVTPVVTDPAEADSQPGAPAPPEIVATAEAIHGVGGVYVANLPRPGDVPAGWLLDRAPRYQPRNPQPGETYQFACEALPARSTGVASVGYRSLEGLPSISVEYVVYPSDELAMLALADMRRAAETCGEFSLTADGGVEARMSALPFPSFGEESFAVALETSSDLTGQLLTHVIKVRQQNVVVGINHAVLAGDRAPETSVSESLSGLAVQYLRQLP